MSGAGVDCRIVRLDLALQPLGALTCTPCGTSMFSLLRIAPDPNTTVTLTLRCAEGHTVEHRGLGPMAVEPLPATAMREAG